MCDPVKDILRKRLEPLFLVDSFFSLTEKLRPSSYTRRSQSRVVPDGFWFEVSMPPSRELTKPNTDGVAAWRSLASQEVSTDGLSVIRPNRTRREFNLLATLDVFSLRLRDKLHSTGFNA